MKRRLLLALLLTLSLQAGAQRVNIQLGAYYQNGQYSLDGNTVKDNFLGVSMLAQFNIFYPESIYLSTGLEASLGLGKDGNVPDYRFEIPLKLSWMWEPTASFSVGPYAGVYGVFNAMVNPDDRSAYNRLQGGWNAGLSMQFRSLGLYGGYWRDFLPFHKGGSPFSGYRITLAFFF